MNILLVEHDYQAADFISKGFDQNAKWIALGPSAMGFLEEKKLSYQIPEDFIDQIETAHYLLEKRSQLRHLLEQLDQDAIKLYPFLSQFKISPFSLHTTSLILCCDIIRHHLLVLNQLAHQFPENKILIHAGIEYPWDAIMRFDNRDTLWGRCAGLLEVDNLKIITNPSVNQKDSLNSNFKNKLRDSCFFAFANLKAFSQKDYKSLAQLWVQPFKKSLLLLGGDEWAEVKDNIENLGFRVIAGSDQFFNRKKFAAPQQKTISNFKQHDFFNEKGVNFYPLIQERLKWIAEQFPLICQKLIKRVTSLKKNYQLKGVLRSTPDSGHSHAFNQIARSLGLPVLVWQHGFVGYGQKINELFGYSDLLTSDGFISYGPQVSQAYRIKSHVSGAKIIDGQSYKLNRIQKNLSSHENKLKPALKNYLYVTTRYDHNGWFLRSEKYSSDRLFYQSQKTIVDYMAQNKPTDPHTRFLVKLHPAKHCQIPPWASPISDFPHIQVIQSKPGFRDLMGESCGILIDSPTTTLLEALITQLPVFVLTRHWQLDNEIIALLSKRAVLAETAEELMELFDDFVKKGNYSADCHNNDFIQSLARTKSEGNWLSQIINRFFTKGVNHDKN